MKTIITVILIIVAVAAVLFILPFAIMLFSYVFGIDMDENGGLHECIGCPYRQSERYCFPCMKKLLGTEEKEHEKEIVFEQEEKKDG